ncbi:Hypothetical protein TART1_1810, partial [Trichococcus shcherbakoviae]
FTITNNLDSSINIYSEFQKNSYSYFKNDRVQYYMLGKFYSRLDFHRSIQFSVGTFVRSESDFGLGKVACIRKKAKFILGGNSFFRRFP